jgi:ribosomal subunit interface protein
MNVQVTFRGMSSTAAIAGHVEERLNHALRHLQSSSRARAVLSPTQGGGFRADIEVDAGNQHIRAHSEEEDLYDAISHAAQKIARQLDDEHAKRTHRRAQA